MNKSALIAIIVSLILVVSGAVFLVNRNDNNNLTQPNSTSQDTSNPNSSTSKSGQTPETGQINITSNMIFTPPQINVQKGGTVTWTNNDDTTHTVTNDLTDVGGPDSGNIAPGDSYSFTFNKTGSFQYHCKIHTAMRGTIVVN